MIDTVDNTALEVEMLALGEEHDGLSAVAFDEFDDLVLVVFGGVVCLTFDFGQFVSVGVTDEWCLGFCVKKEAGNVDLS